MLVAATLLAGCGSVYPQPSEDAVYYFLANARLGGKMRVCWPAGQKYAVGITKAYAGLESELNKIRELMSYGSEWPKDDPRWRDAKAVDEQIAHLEELTSDKSAEARRQALAAIGEAIDKLPDGLSFANDEARDAFKQRLWSALGIGEANIEHLESLAKMRLLVFQAVARSAKLFDTQTEGLRFADAAVQKQVDASYDAFAARVTAERERFFDYAAERMDEIRPLIAKIDKQKQREEYNLLDNERSYFRHTIEGDQRELRELIKAQEKELAKCKKATTPASAEITFHEHRIESLKADLAHVDQRAKQIMKP